MVAGTRRFTTFQSAPDGEVGGDAAEIVTEILDNGFNQPPTVRSGETAPWPSSHATRCVSISPRR